MAAARAVIIRQKGVGIYLRRTPYFECNRYDRVCEYTRMYVCTLDRSCTHNSVRECTGEHRRQ